MGCEIGYDIPNEHKMTECPDCRGSGYVFELFNIRTRRVKTCSEDEYLRHPIEEDDAEKANIDYCRMPLEECNRCHGSGKIELNYK